MILPDDYMRGIADAVHAVGGLFVLDCVASGTIWVDMKDVGVDVLISAPQKGWSASPCSALVMMSEVRDEQQELGDRVRALMAAHGFKSLAAKGFEAPGVVVCYTDDPDIHNGSKFAAAGLQTAAGVPLMCDEPADFRTFRVGLFGLDKLHNVDRTVASLEKALSQVTGGTNVR